MRKNCATFCRDFRLYSCQLFFGKCHLPLSPTPQRLPMNKPTHWVDTPDALASMFEQLCRTGILAVDTESDSFHAYRPGVCLLQFATRRDIFLLDVLAFDKAELAPLKTIMEDRSILKLLHAADNDLHYLQLDLGIFTKNLFDTFLAARFLDLPKRGLGPLLDERFGVQTSKKYQRLNWRMRPIPEGALVYAAMDVRFLIELYEQLSAELAEAGWLDAVEQESLLMLEKNYTLKPFDEEGFWKIQGAKGLSGRKLSVLKSLYLWRHTRCLETNIAAVFILPDHALLRLAQRTPRSIKQIERLLSIDPRKFRMMGEGLLQAIQDGLNTPPPQRVLKRRNKPYRRPVDSELFDVLRAWRLDTAQKDELEPGLLAPNSLLQELARTPPADMVALAQIDGLLKWRLSRYGDDLLDILRKYQEQKEIVSDED
ncbi:MAG: hypothetical protein CL920_14310 [Deltaproteobacteria bacterium]|nr:hypothetical protein [Deltaproteobacteria bacterium]MBU49856.1 hypothetical protein [Deltaproteobacteria bacterium]